MNFHDNFSSHSMELFYYQTLFKSLTKANSKISIFRFDGTEDVPPTHEGAVGNVEHVS